MTSTEVVIVELPQSSVERILSSAPIKLVGVVQTSLALVEQDLPYLQYHSYPRDDFLLFPLLLSAILGPYYNLK